MDFLAITQFVHVKMGVLRLEIDVFKYFAKTMAMHEIGARKMRFNCMKTCNSNKNEQHTHKMEWAKTKSDL